MCESAFFDIDQILAESEPTKVVVALDCYNLDSLDSGAIKLCPEDDLTPIDDDEINDNIAQVQREMQGPMDGPKLGKRCILSKQNDLPAGSKLSVPFWMAAELRRYDFGRLELPIIFSESFKNIALADPRVLDLPSKSRYYYELGMLLADKIQFDTRKSKPLEFVSQMFFERMKILFNLILHLKDNRDHPFLSKLTDMEANYFNRGADTVCNFGSGTYQKKVALKQRNLMNSRKQLKIA